MALANAISDYEPVKMLCHPEDLAAAKRRLCSSIDLIPVALNDAWPGVVQGDGNEVDR